MFTYTGKTALVTGASSGIGAAFAHELAARGMHLILVARSENALNKLATELSARHKIRSEVIVADLSQENAASQIKKVVEERGLHVDLLVNNAGFATYNSFDLIDPERDHQQVMVNVSAVVDMAHAFLPAMVARGEGAIINVASMAAFMPLPYMAVYAASKAFVLSLSESLWAENRQRGIRVVALCPGEVETHFHETANLSAAAGQKRTPQQVVEASLHAIEKSKSSVIPGSLNKLSILTTRLMSRSFLALGAVSRLRPKNLKDQTRIAK